MLVLSSWQQVKDLTEEDAMNVQEIWLPEQMEQGWFSGGVFTLPLSHSIHTKILVLNQNSLKSEELNRCIKDWKKLERLELSCNSITTLEFLKEKPHLQHVDLSHNYIVKISGDVLDTPQTTQHHIQYLDLSFNRLVDIPTELVHLKSTLKVLNLKNNQITILPDETMSALHKLEFLDVSYNRLKSLWETMHPLKQLKQIHAQGNAIQTLPLQLPPSLQVLNVKENYLTGLISTLFENSGKLQVLELDKNMLTHLPDCSPCHALQVLKMNHMKAIATFGEGLFPIKLETLEMRYCFTEEFPTTKIEPLLNLTVLDISGSEFTKVIGNFTQLKQLKQFIANDCPKLTVVDKSIGTLPSIERIELKNCPSLQDPPVEVVQLGYLAIIAYMNGTLQEEGEEDAVKAESKCSIM